MARAGHDLPDVIESAGAKTKKAATIKSHHNVGGLPETLHLKLLEPLRELFKDEVRELGLALGLPREMVFRHPFPGPGLGVRILGEVEKEYVELLQRADDIFIEELRSAGWYDKTAQAFAVFLPVKSVGVMGDGRTYEYVVALRAVQTTDFMTADWAPLPHELLAQGLQPHHQRGARHQPRDLRHLLQAARHHRVGVAAGGWPAVVVVSAVAVLRRRRSPTNAAWSPTVIGRSPKGVMERLKPGLLAHRARDANRVAPFHARRLGT